jgi:quinol monooxygenase YgiN
MSTERVRVIAHFTILADKIEAFIAAARATLVEPTRREPGCLLYDLCQDAAEPTRFALVEEWENAAALQRHLAQPALQAAVAALRPMGASPIEVHHYRSVAPVVE